MDKKVIVLMAHGMGDIAKTHSVPSTGEK